MTVVGKVLLKLADGRKVWRIISVRYRDAVSGKFISGEEMAEPDGVLSPDKELDLAAIEKQILTTLIEVVSNPEMAGKSTGSMRLLVEQVDKLKREKAENLEEGEWFILGRELAGEVLALVEANLEDFEPNKSDGTNFAT
ncbi:MAG: hypothetical protein JW757_00865 [Anaerolineales bacterium]|nr:hypothetical protein [Anaerolineales bacterium]